jgi:hypothetical protein
MKLRHACSGLCAAALFVLASAVVFADTDVAGNWRVEFTVPTGEVAVNMTINQDGRTLSGRVINEDGEFPLKGTLDGDQITVSWVVPEQGEQMEIVMKGTVSGETIDGTARLGNVGEGSLSARRVSRNP